MLTRRGRAGAVAIAGAAAAVTASAGLALASPAGLAGFPAADPTSPVSVTCPPGEQPSPITGQCTISVTVPGGPPSSTTAPGSGTAVCHEPNTGIVVPCYDPKLGWYNGVGCYLKLTNPQPPASDPVWNGKPPGTGAIYDATCYVMVAGVAQLQPMGMTWQLTPPGGTVTPADVAQIAIKKLTMHGPSNGIAPPVGSYALVGMPVWLWTVDDADHWGPLTASASAGGITVNATARATGIVWHMGDGNTKSCGRGTQYAAGAAPSCTYTYTTTSAHASDQSFSLYGVTTWVITWSGGGQTGTVTTTVQSAPVPVRVESAQALTTS